MKPSLKDLGIIGLVVPNITLAITKVCKQYGVETVQVPLHITQPEPSHVQHMIYEGIIPCLKWVPPLGAYKRILEYVDLFHKWFSSYSSTVFWDIGGEPETRPSQPGCRWDSGPDELAELMQTIYSVSLDYTPKFFLGCGFLSATFNGLNGNEDRSDFVRKLFRSTPFPRYVNAVSVNQYCYGYGGDKNILDGYQHMKELVLGKEMIVAEAGVPSRGDPHFLHIIQTEYEQACSLVKVFIRSLGCGYKTVYWFKMMGGGWGIFNSHLEPKPAAKTLRFLSSLVNREHSLGIKQIRALPCDERFMVDHIIWYQVESSLGNYVNIIWSDVPTPILTRKPSYAVYNVLGERQRDLEITPDPKIIVTESVDSLQRLEY